MSLPFRRALPSLLAAFALIGPAFEARADDEETDGRRFESLFNGRDLSGWKLGGETLDGKAESADHGFAVKAGVLACRGAKPWKVVETTRAFPGDFVLRLEFRASPKADSGVFLRGKQLQIKDYPAVGPYKTLKHFRDGDWNAIEVVVKGGVARCTCNGEVLEEAIPIKGKGGIGLQSETNLVEYRRIVIRELR